MTIEQRVACLFLLGCAGLSCSQTPHRVPKWGSVKPGVMYDTRTGLRRFR